MFLSAPHFDLGTCLISQAAANALAKYPASRGLDAILRHHKNLAPGAMSVDHLMLRVVAAKAGRAVISEFSLQSKNATVRNRATFIVTTDAARTLTVVMLAAESPAWTDGGTLTSSTKPVEVVEPNREN